MRVATSTARAQADEGSTHPFEIGKVVSVIRLPVHEPPYEEGLAIIQTAAPGHHRYCVRFIGDPRVYVRFVHPSYQSDPAGTLMWLRELWRAGIEADANFSDFFPEDI